ncbi:MAG: right-handed parallel beta-helix repeat-containing protein [Pseudomonadota bacterium]
MTEFACTQADGCDGIEAALSRARPGDVVRLDPGHYFSSRGIRVPEGVTLDGYGAVLVHRGEGPAVMAMGVNDVTLIGLTIQSRAVSVPKRLEPDGPVLPDDAPMATEWGLLFVDRASNARLRDVTVDGNPTLHFQRGIVLRATTGSVVSDCKVRRTGGSGISLISGEGALIQNCKVWSGGASGISVFAASTGEISMGVSLVDNRCHDNSGAGMVLFSAEVETLSGNECWGNTTGIALQRDSKSADSASRVVALEGNRCHDNSYAGMLLASAEVETLSGNECWGNEHGIALQRDPDSADSASRVVALIDNRCHDNSDAGIGLVSAEVETLSGNECWGNTTGIALQRDSKSADSASRVVALEGNRCHDNSYAGMLLASAEVETLSGNECWGNTTGIALQRDPDSADSASRVVALEGNRCHDNSYAGMLLASAEVETLSGNECWGNEHGIALQRDPDSADSASRVVALIDNRCHDNSGAGMVLFSAEVETLSGNECWGNTTGIALQRDSKSADAASRVVALIDNRCHDNSDAGIGLVSAEVETLSGNECWGNTTGIALQRDSKSADSASRVVALEGNRCHDNSGAGIVLLMAEVETLSGNECWGNTTGIALQRDSKSADSASRVVALIDNRCHDNSGAGMLLFSAEVETLSGNECWGNTTGIALQRDSKSADSASRVVALIDNRCHDNSGAGMVLFSAEVETLSGNECWGNTTGIALQRDSKSADAASTVVGAISANVLFRNQIGLLLQLGMVVVRDLGVNHCFGNQIDPSWVAQGEGGGFSPVQDIAGQSSDPPPQFGNQDEWIRARAHESQMRSFAGELASHLDAKRLEEPEKLARFLTGAGCIDCLRAWCADVPGDESVEPASADVLHHICKVDGQSRRLSFEPVAEEQLRQYVLHGIARLARKGGSAAHRLGLVATTSEVITRLAEDLALVREASAKSQSGEMPIPADCQDLVALLDSLGKQLAPPIVIDYTLRSELALRDQLANWPLFEEVLMSGRRRWQEALVELVSTAKAWRDLVAMLVLLACVFAGFGWLRAEADGSELTLAQALLHGIKLQFEAVDPLDILKLPLGVLALFLGARWILNRYLPSILLPSSAPRWLAFLGQDESGRHLANNDAWQHWFKRRVFGADVAVVMIRGVGEWLEDDARRLREVIALAGQTGLLVIVETHSRDSVDRSLLLPFTETDETGINVAQLDGVELVLEEQEPTDLPLYWRFSGHPADIDLLLGLRDRGAQTLRPANPGQWSLTHILPMLVVGSTAEFNFSLRRNVDPTLEVFWPPLAEELLPYARLFSRDPARELPKLANDSALNQMLAAAEESPSILVSRIPGDQVQLLGRGAMKAELAASLQAALAIEEIELNRYLATLMACGVVNGYREATRVLAKGTLGEVDIARCIAALGAVAHLTGEIALHAPLDQAQLEIVDDWRRQLAAQIECAPAPRGAMARAAASRLYAAAIRVGAASDLVLSAGRTSVTREEPLTLRDCFLHQLDVARHWFQRADLNISLQYAMDALRPEMRQLGPHHSGLLRQQLEEESKQGKFLVEMLEEAADETALLAILEDNRIAGYHLVEAVYLVLVRAAVTLERQVKAGEIMDAHWRWNVRRGAPAGSRAQKLDIGQPTGSLALDWETFVSTLLEQRVIDLLSDVSQHGVNAAVSSLPDIQLGYFDRLCGQAVDLVEISFRFDG